MYLNNSDLCNYLSCSDTAASRFKKLVIEHTGKKDKRITVADLANYEQATIKDIMSFIKPQNQNHGITRH